MRSCGSRLCLLHSLFKHVAETKCLGLHIVDIYACQTISFIIVETIFLSKPLQDYVMWSDNPLSKAGNVEDYTPDEREREREREE